MKSIQFNKDVSIKMFPRRKTFEHGAALKVVIDYSETYDRTRYTDALEDEAQKFVCQIKGYLKPFGSVRIPSEQQSAQDAEGEVTVIVDLADGQDPDTVMQRFSAAVSALAAKGDRNEAQMKDKRREEWRGVLTKTLEEFKGQTLDDPTIQSIAGRLASLRPPKKGWGLS